MPRVLAAFSKPVAVDAVRFTDSSQVGDLLSWLAARRGVGHGSYEHRSTVVVDTIDGRKTARLGDWILALPHRQFRVLDNASFEQRYDLIGFSE